jgi:hypothetical protein
MRPQDLTTAKTVAKISVVSNTAGGKKSVARADPQVLTIPLQRRLRLPALEDVDAAGVDQVGADSAAEAVSCPACLCDDAHAARKVRLALPGLDGDVS